MAKQFFPNGYGVSVIATGYGGADGLYELAVIKGTEGDWVSATPRRSPPMCWAG